MTTKSLSISFCAFLIYGLASSGPGEAEAQTPPGSVPTFPNSVTVMSYNIHEGKGTDGTLDLNRIADVINAVGPDLVVLQEVDKNTEGSGFVDQPAVLAALTFMNHEFGKAMDWDKGEFGNVILTKHPYTLIGNYLLPKVKRNQEPRAALFLEVDLSSIYGHGASITFVGTHLDNRRAQSRIQAASFIDTILAGLPDRPALLGGDLNDVPGTVLP